MFRHRTAAAFVLLVAAIAVAAVLISSSRDTAHQARIDQEVAQLLQGIPQHNRTLGYPGAPVTLEVFADLKDPDSRQWFDRYLPAILQQDVRTGRLQLRFHAYKTGTAFPDEFVGEQTAALAAGAQNKLWNYAYTFYDQENHSGSRSVYERYVTGNFLESVAHQVPGLDVTQWLKARHTERREEQPSEETKTAGEDQLHGTPSYRIGKTGQPLTNYSGSTLIKRIGQRYPISLVSAEDLDQNINKP
jgi:hypothetical protein